MPLPCVEKESDQVWISIPEQGFSGIAKIESISPYLFTVPDIGEKMNEGLVLSPITGIFTHTSKDVWELIFDNSDTLRATYAHPLFSLNKNGWRPAGELAPGEEVLSKQGKAILTAKKPLSGSFPVYNLEVGGLHNFLVGKSGIAAHNSCLVEELTSILRISYRKIYEERFTRPLAYLNLRPIEKALADMPDWKFNRFVEELRGKGGVGPGEIRAELVRAWEKLASLTGTREWTRRSIPSLEKMSGKTDELMEKVKQYYSTHTKPSGTGTPPFTHQGIDFDDFGHPDFFNSIACPGQQYCLKTDNLLGHPTSGLPTDLKPDFNLANQNLLTNGKEINVLHSSGSPILIKIDGKWEGPFTWHHHQDGKTMLPVKEDIHNSMSHTGGDSAIKKLIKGFFTSPF